MPTSLPDGRAQPRSEAQQRATAAATEARAQQSALRALDSPVQLARAARIVRTALQRRKLTLADLGLEPEATP